jgi:MscS family membrane protein
MDLSKFPELLSAIDISGFPWLWEVFFVILVTLIAHYVLGKLFIKLEQQLNKTANLWDDALVESARRPAGAMIWLVGFSWVLDVLTSSSDAAVFKALGPARELLVIGIIGWFLIRVIKQIEQRLISNEYTHEPVDQTTVLALGKLVRVSVFITVSLVVLQTLGYSISGVLAFGGIGGIAVGFAAKDLLANFFGGLMIYMDRPFSVGNWIRSPDQEIEGTVEHIGWRQTRIRTFDKRPLYVPNATFSHISVENPSRMLNRRIKETIGVRYDDASLLAAIVSDVEQLLRNHEDLDQDQTIIVNFNSFGASSLDFFIYCFTRTTDWVEFHGVKQKVLLQVLDIVLEHGADVAYPTSTLKLPDSISIEQQPQSEPEPEPESETEPQQQSDAK